MEALGRRALACPRWRWMSGMSASGPGWFESATIVDVEPDGSCPTLWVYRGYARGPQAANRFADTDEWDGGGIPELDDPATLGCVVALIRTLSGGKCAFDDDWCRVTVPWGDYETVLFAEALVAALEAAP